MASTLSTAPLTDDELDFLQAHLDRYAQDDAIHCVSELDGYFTALVSCPRAVPFDDWYATLWGGVQHVPTGACEPAFQSFRDLLAQHMNQLAVLLEQDIEHFSPIFNVLEDDDSISVEDWCLGYERGVLVGGGWDGLPEDEQDLLAMITLHTLGIDVLTEDPPQHPGPDEYAGDASIELIPIAAIALHHYWAQRRRDDLGMDAEAKPGRDDLCPCGSGRTFKHCCLH